jgi:hypothetical protein
MKRREVSFASLLLTFAKQVLILACAVTFLAALGVGSVAAQSCAQKREARYQRCMEPSKKHHHHRCAAPRRSCLKGCGRG